MLRARPVMRTRSPVRVIRRRRRWQWVSWWFSLLLVVPIALIVADQAFGIAPGKDKKPSVKTLPAVTFHVADAASGQAVAGAEVRAGTVAATSDALGVASLTMPGEAVIVTVSHPGYEPVYGHADTSIAHEQTVALRALPADQGQSDASQTQNAGSPDTEKPNTGGGSAPATGNNSDAEENAPAPTSTAGNEASVVGQLTGKVTAENGDPIKGAMVAAGDVRVKTKRDGTFKLTGAPDRGELVVSASGYADKKL